MRAVLTALLGTAALAAGCGGDSETSATSRGSQATAAEAGATTPATTVDPVADLEEYSGGTVSPVTAAPELGLHTWNGKDVRIGDYRGQAVLVTFVYTNCPDVCPLIVDNLVRVKERLGPDGRRLQIVSVSVDPERDTPQAVKRFLTRHRAHGRVDYLIGSRRQLEGVWARWGIAARVDKANPRLVEHSGVIWGVDPKGRRVTFYPASGFDVADIEGDVRNLLGS
jgi:protein SCO1/2